GHCPDPNRPLPGPRSGRGDQNPARAQVPDRRDRRTATHRAHRRLPVSAVWREDERGLIQTPPVVGPHSTVDYLQWTQRLKRKFTSATSWSKGSWTPT